MNVTKIKDIRCIRTRADGTWVIVKVITDQPGLYGIGSASDHYHARTVITAIEEHRAAAHRPRRQPYRGYLAEPPTRTATGATAPS